MFFSSFYLCLLVYLVCLITIFSHLQGWLGVICLRIFRKHERAENRLHIGEDAQTWPKVTVLKPLYGDEPLLKEALASFCRQNYPDYEIIFGLHSKDDKALKHVKEIKKEFPDLQIKTVINAKTHGLNGKVSNLINMFPSAKNDYLVIADSDMYVSPTYLKHIVQKIKEDQSCLVTTLYAARATKHTLAAFMGCLGINLNFLPGVLLARALGRQDCLGATMALHRSMLEKIGGLEMLVDYVADDALLGRLVLANGGNVQIALTLTHTSVAETRMKDLASHEVRWGRTTRSVAPIPYAASIMQFPLFWTTVAVALSFIIITPFSWTNIAIATLISWMSRTLMELAIVNSVRFKNEKTPLIAPLILPIRDIMSGIIVGMSLFGREVKWKGTKVQIHAMPNKIKSSPKTK